MITMDESRLKTLSILEDIDFNDEETLKLMTVWFSYSSVEGFKNYLARHYKGE